MFLWVPVANSLMKTRLKGTKNSLIWLTGRMLSRFRIYEKLLGMNTYLEVNTHYNMKANASLESMFCAL